jgi:Tc toxin complex TcA C-terminal TcB-binding domain
MFELDFAGDKYLPFEGTGAVSRLAAGHPAGKLGNPADPIQALAGASYPFQLPFHLPWLGRP